MSAKTLVAIAIGVLAIVGIYAFLIVGDASPPSTPPPSASALPSEILTESTQAIAEPKAVEPKADESAAPSVTPADAAKPTGPGRIIGIAVLPDDTPKIPVHIALHRIDVDTPIISYADTLFATVDTGLDGKFTFERLPLGAYIAYALTGTHTAQRQATLTRAMLESNLNLTMFPGGNISGHVFTPDHKPVPGAIVFPGAWDVGGQKAFARRDRALSSRQTTDENGAFTLQYLRASSGANQGYRIAAIAEGYAATLSDYVKVGTSDLEIVLSEGAIVNGSLIHADTGEPISGKTVLLESQLPIDQRSAVSDADGFFFVPNVAFGNQTASLLDDELIVIPESALFDVPKDAESTEVTLRASKGGAISGRVYDADSGKGMGGVSVTASESRDTNPRKATTAADGTYHLRPLKPAQIDVYFEMPKGYGVADDESQRGRTIKLSMGETVQGVDLALSRGLSIGGVAVDDTGKPLSGVRLDVSVQNGAEPSSDPTGDQGTFLISGFQKDNTVSLYPSKDGFAQVSIEPNLEKGVTLRDSVSGIRITMTPESTVSGTVVDQHGTPIPNVSMSVQTVGEPPQHAGTGNSDSKGAIQFTRLPPGEYRFQFRDLDDLFGNSDTNDDASIVQLKLARGEKVTGVRFVRATEGGLTISGRVYDPKGSPVAEAWILLSNNGERNAMTDATGAYTITGLAEGEYELTARRQDFDFSDSIKTQAGATGIDLRLKDYAKIEGRVVSARTGQPVTEFSIDSVTPPIRVRDAEGKFILEKRSEGTKVVNISATGYSPGAVAVPDLRTGEVRRGVVVRLEQGIELSGTVKDSSGRPVDGASVGIHRTSGTGGLYYLRDARAETRADGSYRIDSLPAGTFTFHASRDGFPPKYVEVALVAGGQNRADFVLSAGGSVTGIVTRNGKPVSEIDVNANVEPGGGGARTDAAGRYRIDHLSAGSGKVRANIYENQRNVGGSKDISIVEGQTTEANIELSGGNAAIVGTVFESPNVPVRGRPVGVGVTSGDRRSIVSMFIDSEGNFKFDGLPAGPARLEVNDPESPTPMHREFDVELVAAREIRQDIVLSEGTMLHIRISGSIPSTAQWFVSLFYGAVRFNGVADIRNDTYRESRIVGTSLDSHNGQTDFSAPAPGIYTVLVYEWDNIKSQLAQEPIGRWAAVEVEVKSEPEITIPIEL